MEPLTMFASTIGLISAIHLLSVTSEKLGKGIYDRGVQQEKREDWYCFFQPADLLGSDWNSTRDNNQQPSVTDSERLEQRRRQQASRPRLHA